MRGVGDDDLDRLAAALGVENVEREAVLLEDAGVLPELGDEGLADAARADRKLEMVLGDGAVMDERQDSGDGRADQRPRPTHAPPSLASQDRPGLSVEASK